MLRIFFVSDIHGSDKLFYKLMNAVRIYQANIAIIGGDIAGKALVPIFQKDGVYETDIDGEKKVLQSKEQVDLLMNDIRARGDYPLVTTGKEWSELLNDESKMNSKFEELMKQGIQRWCKIAEERLRPISARLIMNTGNDDPAELANIIESSGFVEYPNEKVIELDQHHEILSLGYSNLTPWRLPGDLTEEELKMKIEDLLSKTRNLKNSIFNIHVPPYNTHLDIAPKLDENLRPKLGPGGEPEFAHVGSIAVRDAIEKYQPLAGLHGHIHESRGYSKIGRTHCFNPGSEYSSGVLKGVLINLSAEKIESHAFTSG